MDHENTLVFKWANQGAAAELFQEPADPLCGARLQFLAKHPPPSPTETAAVLSGSPGICTVRRGFPMANVLRTVDPQALGPAACAIFGLPPPYMRP